ncbi:hypothetical protein D3C87_1556790 [compost metagenome]
MKPQEIPDWAGLIEISDGNRKIVVPAPLRDKDAPSWELIVSLLRNSGQIRRDADLIRKERDSLRYQVRKAAEKIREEGKLPWQFGIHGH